MHKQFYFLSPVEVVKVSSQNLEEVAEWCGGKVAKTESSRVPGRMDSYVWVPTPKGSHISWAFPGMFITKRLVINLKGELRATWAVFRRDYFEKNYFESPQDSIVQTWEKANRPKKPVPKPTPPKERPPARDIHIYMGGAAQFSEEIEKVKEQVREIANAAGVELDVEAAATAIVQVQKERSAELDEKPGVLAEIKQDEAAVEVVEKELGGVEIGTENIRVEELPEPTKTITELIESGQDPFPEPKTLNEIIQKKPLSDDEADDLRLASLEHAEKTDKTS